MKKFAYLLAVVLLLSVAGCAAEVSADPEEAAAYEWARENGVPEEFLDAACANSVVSLYNECRDLEGEMIFDCYTTGSADKLSSEDIDFIGLSGKQVVDGEIQQVIISTSYVWKKSMINCKTDYIEVEWDKAWKIVDNSFFGEISGNGTAYDTYTYQTSADIDSLMLAFKLKRLSMPLSGYVQFWLVPGVTGYTDAEMYRTSLIMRYNHETVTGYTSSVGRIGILSYGL